MREKASLRTTVLSMRAAMILTERLGSAMMFCDGSEGCPCSALLGAASAFDNFRCRASALYGRVVMTLMSSSVRLVHVSLLYNATQRRRAPRGRFPRREKRRRGAGGRVRAFRCCARAAITQQGGGEGSGARARASGGAARFRRFLPSCLGRHDDRMLWACISATLDVEAVRIRRVVRASSESRCPWR